MKLKKLLKLSSRLTRLERELAGVALDMSSDETELLPMVYTALNALGQADARTREVAQIRLAEFNIFKEALDELEGS